jgi:hypothetical protein
MWTARWLKTMVPALVAVTLHAHDAGPSITIEGGTTAQRAIAEWAVGRFDIGGLNLPSLEIRLHPDQDGCRGRLGYWEEGVANLCATHTNHIAVRTMIHELAHAWLDANVSQSDRNGFLALRGLRTWNGQDVAWDERGYEQAAEIVAWGLHDQGTGIHTPAIPGNSAQELADAYLFLTSRALPELPLGGGPELTA